MKALKICYDLRPPLVRLSGDSVLLLLLVVLNPDLEICQNATTTIWQRPQTRECFRGDFH